MNDPDSADASARCDPDWARHFPWPESGLAEQDFPPGLYVVATPLGNAADVTLRALWVIRLADWVACEDTRTTGALLARYGLRRPLLALHRHNEDRAADAVAEHLRRGQRVALVSDAGTPAICDPGAMLVRRLLDEGHRVLPVPGASSLTAALSVAGVLAGDVHFGGFAPARGAARRAHWQRLARQPGAVVIFEAPHRVVAAAHELAAAFDPRRRVLIARELTKKFESVRQATVAALVQAIEAEPVRGEYVFVVDAAPQDSAPAVEPGMDAVTTRWLEALAEELPASRAAAVAARASGGPRDVFYEWLTARGDPAGARGRRGRT